VEWHINDLSLAGQYETPVNFRDALEPLLKLRHRSAAIAARIYCSRSFTKRLSTSSHSVQHAVLALKDKDYTTLVLTWLSKAGPFWDDERRSNPDDYFHFEETDVTEQGLGEAARRRIGLTDAGVFSFLDGTRRFARTPLRVGHGLPEEPLGEIDVPNWWDVSKLAVAATPEPEGWTEMLNTARIRFQRLKFSDAIDNVLRSVPFHGGIVHLIFERLSVLEAIANETIDAHGTLSDRGKELREEHFVGRKAQFSAEKPRRESDLSFPDPDNPRTQLFCPWHGKVKLGQFRIHFEWPRPDNQQDIKVAYIGPKITKT
jgi:hypothetical protein